MASRHEVSILLATHGRPECLKATLRSLASVSDPNQLTRVVVVENGRQCGAEGVVSAFSSELPMRWMYHGPGNKSAALNVGLQVVPSGLVILVDDDVKYQPGWLDAYVSAAHDYPSAVYFAGAMVARHDELPDQRYLPFMTASTKGWTLGAKDCWMPRRANCLGCNWAVMRRDLSAIGGFDETVGPGSATGATGQESDAQRRLRKLGIRGRYLGGAVVEHRVSVAQLSEEWILQRRERTGRELGRYVCSCFPPLLRRSALRVLVAMLKKRFRSRNPRLTSELKGFEQEWWAAYLRGARAELAQSK